MKHDTSRRRNTGLYMAGAFVVGGIIGAVAGVLVFINVVGGSGEASAPISAPTLSLDVTATNASDFAFAPAATLAQIAANVESLAQTDQQAAAVALNTQVSQLVTLEPSPTSAPATNAPPTNAPTTVPTDVPATFHRPPRLRHRAGDARRLQSALPAVS